MEPRIIEGVWEDVAAKHASALKGHRVEIRVLAKEDKGRSQLEKWHHFIAEVGKITKGKRIPNGRIYTAEDFYESQD